MVPPLRGRTYWVVRACAVPAAIFTVGLSLLYLSVYLRMCEPSLAFLFQVSVTRAEPSAQSLCACVP